jgi:DNA repair protein RadC
MTKNIQNAGEILDIKLLDHIIIGENSFYSFAEAGLL